MLWSLLDIVLILSYMCWKGPPGTTRIAGKPGFSWWGLTWTEGRPPPQLWAVTLWSLWNVWMSVWFSCPLVSGGQRLWGSKGGTWSSWARHYGRKGLSVTLIYKSEVLVQKHLLSKLHSVSVGYHHEKQTNKQANITATNNSVSNIFEFIIIHIALIII